MKAYQDLTETGIKRRLGMVVSKALDQYDIGPAKVSFLDEATNMFYKIETESGDRFAAKVVQDEGISLEDNQIEAYILKVLKENAKVLVPTIVNNKQGKPVTIIKSHLTPSERRVVVYEWFEGIDLEDHENDALFRKLGQVTAQLHNALEHIKLPAEIEGKSWREVFYFKGEEPVYREAKYQHLLPEDYVSVMDKIIAYLDEKLPTYYEGNHVFTIHGDLNPSNVKIVGDDLVIFDFEDHIQGTPLHDLAILFFYYWLDPNFDFDRVKKLVLEGYEEIRLLQIFSDFDLELLMTARRVNFLNYILLIHDQPQKYIERNLNRVKDFINQYLL